MMLKLTNLHDGNVFLVNIHNIQRIRFYNGETLIVFSDDISQGIKETPDEIMAQIERIKIKELAIERIFRNPQYTHSDVLIDFGFILKDVQRFKHHNEL